MSFPFDFARERNVGKLSHFNPGSSGINQDAIGMALIGRGIPAYADRLSNYDSRKLPHFQMKGKASKTKRGK